MIVSHKHRFIYVKAHKVAGTSIEYALAHHCGPDDIVTSVKGYDPKIDGDYYEWPSRNSEGIDSHLTTLDVRSMVGEQVWNDYHKIVTIRNPWDMLVSFFFWWRSQPRSEKMPKVFDKFVWWHLSSPVGAPTNKPYWLSNGEIWADTYIRFEHLEEDCSQLFSELGLEFKGLPRLKTRVREKSKLHYSEFYCGQTKGLVRHKYRKIVNWFEYTFENKTGS